MRTGMQPCRATAQRNQRRCPQKSSRVLAPAHCADPRTQADTKTYEWIIRDYDRQHRDGAMREQRWFADRPSLLDAISCAAMARWENSNKLEHQWRLRNLDLHRAKNALLQLEREIAACDGFDDLYNLISTAIGHIWQDAELYCYDTALRIGAKLGLKPDKIYLHRGTREGARRLVRKVNGPTLEVSALPKPFCNLEAFELEDILCIYKDEF